jgi:PPK2 family polyphosphate:nucleotide phosphotransferase
MSFLRLPAGPVDLSTVSTRPKDGVDGLTGKKELEKSLQELGSELSDLQERLWAEKTTGSRSRVLLVLQGMDTSGKGGVLRHTVGLIDPQGLKLTSFKAPTDEEKAHDFLWRIEKAVPEPGYVGVFDRSHYEDVLIVKVHEWADTAEIERRYGAINDFEARLTADGVTIVKCILHISAAEQKDRLMARLADPSKYYKYNPGDIDEREHWAAYQQAYEVALERTNTDVAPWHVVPSDSKALRNYAIGKLLLETLRGLDLQWPPADFDVAAEQQRLHDEAPIA